MTGYPSILFALLQGLLTAVLMLAPPLLYAFVGKLRTTPGDVLLMLCTIPALTIVTSIVFFPFEGDWVDSTLGPLVAFRTLLLGGLLMTLGMAFTQRKTIGRRGGAEAVVRLAAAFLIGAVWGTVWGFAGWLLPHIGILDNG